MPGILEKKVQFKLKNTKLCMQTIEDVTAELIAEACEDQVGLWLVISKVRDDLHIDAPGDLERITLEVVRGMLQTGQVEAGYYKLDGTGIISWKVPIAEILSKIADGWTQLAREPGIGEIVVFVGTAREQLIAIL